VYSHPFHFKYSNLNGICIYEIKDLPTHFVNIGAEKFNQGEFRKPGCILVFGVLFDYFLDKQKVT